MKTAADRAAGSPSKAPAHPKPDKRSRGKRSGQESDEVLGQLPHERDQTPEAAGDEPREKIKQAHQDIERGLVDTDMRATPGLDASQRKKIVKPGN